MTGTVAGGTPPPSLPAPATGLPGDVVPAALESEFPAPSPSRSPQLLRRLQVLVALAALLAGVAWAWVLIDLRSDLASAPELAQQYARLGQVQHNLNRAAVLADRHAISGEATDGPLAEESTEQLALAAGLLVEAVRDRPQDAAALSALSQDLSRYTAALTYAAGKPRAEAIPLLARADGNLDALSADLAGLQATLSTEASERPWSQGLAIPLLVTLAMIGCLAWAGWVVARLSRRVLNLGLVSAALALVLGLIVTATAQTAAAEASQSSRGTQFGHVANSTNAVTELQGAHRVLTAAVLAQLWSADRDADYRAALEASQEAASREDLAGVNAFGTAATAVIDLLAEGSWKAAATALQSDGDDALDALAEGFRTRADAVVADAAAEAATNPETARAGMVSQLVLVIVLALAGAALGVLGLDRRRQEYR